MARTGKVRPCDTHDSVTKSDIYYNTTVPKKVWCDAGTVAVAEVVGSCVLAIRKSLTLSLVKFTGLQKTLSFSIEFFSCVMPPK